MVEQLTLLQKLQRDMQTRKFEKHSKESYTWLQRKAKGLQSMGSLSLRKAFMKDQTKTKQVLKGEPGKIHIGSMICYLYDPKYKETLPYYDIFPVGFLIGVGDDGSWTMLNLHYLPPQWRAVLFDKLLTVSNNQRFDKTTKLRLTYDILKAASKFKLFAPCFKKYLPSHVRSKVIKINPADWEIVMFLPLASFQKATSAKVWKDSLGKVKK